jgi:hypothetical protein
MADWAAGSAAGLVVAGWAVAVEAAGATAVADGWVGVVAWLECGWPVCPVSTPQCSSDSSVQSVAPVRVQPCSLLGPGCLPRQPALLALSVALCPTFSVFFVVVAQRGLVSQTFQNIQLCLLQEDYRYARLCLLCKILAIHNFNHYLGIRLPYSVYFCQPSLAYSSSPPLRPAIGDVRSLTAWIVSCSTTLVESLEEKHSEREMLTQLCKEVLASAMSLLPLYTSGKIQEAFKRLQESTRAYSNLSTPNS